jgi:SSS family solute:Na+ symporter
MNIVVLIVVLLYEFVSIFGIGLFISHRNKKKGKEEAGGFAFAGGGLPASLMGITLALTLLGSAHNWGTCANVADMGVIAVWFGIACAIMMVVITQITGPWIRRSGAKTAGEFLGHIFGKKAGALISAMNAATSIAMACMEVEVIAVTLSMLTGLNFAVCAVIGGVLAILYVVLAGMKEIAWLNLINAILMYVSLIAVFICLCINLPEGWEGVQQTLEASQDTSWMTSIFGNSSLIISFAIPSALGASMFHGMAQTGYQPIATAKNNHEVKKSILFAGPINGCFCILPALIGIAAFSFVSYRNAGAMMMSPEMIVALCPKWVVALLAMGFMGVDLSSFAVMALAPATIISNDMYTLYKPDATEEQKTKLSRILIFVIGVFSILLCNLQPSPTPMVNWMFSFGIPVFIMALFGVWWKRSEIAAVVTIVVTWVVVCIWSTFGLQTTLGMDNFHVTYLSLIVSLVLGIILTAVLPGKKGLYVGKNKRKA